MLRVLLAFGLVCLLPLQAPGQEIQERTIVMKCAKTDFLMDFLAKNGGEKPALIGHFSYPGSASSKAIALLRNPHTNVWTLTILDEDMACVVAMGQGLVVDPGLSGVLAPETKDAGTR